MVASNPPVAEDAGDDDHVHDRQRETDAREAHGLPASRRGRSTDQSRAASRQAQIANAIS